MRKLKFITILGVFVSCFLFVPAADALAQFYKTDYNFTFTLGNKEKTEVKLNVLITNVRSDIYVRELNLSIPNSFSISRLKAVSPSGPVEILSEKREKLIKYSFVFSNPVLGKDNSNKLQLTYLQKNVFKTQGKITEAIIPTLISSESDNVNINILIPDNYDSKISISKPIPTKISDNLIEWKNLTKPVIYAVFGQSQIYNLNLQYHLRNTGLTPAEFEIAIPPETLYQKMYVLSISPEPEEIYIDIDGNYLAKYILSPKAEQEIIFKGAVEVFANSQQDFKPLISRSLKKQKKYLLSSTTFWDAQNLVEDKSIKELKNINDVYAYVVDKLDYSYNRVSKNIERFGAEKAYHNPKKAVCMEFTDLFIALAREKGYYAREIQGYGFTQDPQLRPLSLVGDLLHSWGEYYDKEKETWIQVDPTWEDTSKIDYFNAFDLNHIAFVIHGRNPDYPPPAGTYKTEDSVDVSVEVAESIPKDIRSFTLDNTIRKKITSNTKYKAKFSIVNNGNIFLKNTAILLESDAIDFTPSKYTISLLAPMQKKTYEFSYITKREDVKISEVAIKVNREIQSSHSIKITSTKQQLTAYLLSASIGLILIAVIVFVYRRNEN